MDLDLTEARIRRAITTLEAVGFLDRAILPSGSRYKATEHDLHRRPVKYCFGAEYGSMFVLANKRASRAKDGDPAARRPHSVPERPTTVYEPPTGFTDTAKVAQTLRAKRYQGVSGPHNEKGRPSR